MRTCVSFRARRSSRKVISSAISSTARSSTLLRCAGLSFVILSFTFTAMVASFSSSDGQDGHPSDRQPSESALVEAFFAVARFVPTDEQDCRPLRIKGKSHSPFTIGCTEAQLLHVRVTGAFRRVNARPPQLRTELLEKAR